MAEKIKRCLQHKRSKQVLVFVFFLFLSGLFWFVQALKETYETELILGLEIIDVPTDVVLTNELPQNLVVKVSDQGTNLLRYFPNSGKTKIKFSFEDFDDGSNHGNHVISPEQVVSSLRKILSSTTQILSYSPDTLEFYYARSTVCKRVPVRFVGSITTDPLHYLDSLGISPDSVSVCGDKGLIDTLQCVYTENFSKSGVSSTQQYSVLMASIKGAKIRPARVNVKAVLDIYTQRSVEVPIHAVNFPAGLTLRTFPSRAMVTYRVGMSHFKEITDDLFILTISYEDILNLTDSVLPLNIHSLPDHVSQVQIEPSVVQYMIEKSLPESEEKNYE